MSHLRSSFSRFGSVSLFLLAAFYGPAPLPAADPAEQVDALLAAGEFGPALVAAGQANDAKLKNKLLGNIAAAQAAGGARRGALETAYDISSDLDRKAALDRVRSPGAPSGARGGGTGADFDSLIDLIQTTIAPTSWDTVGGVGTIDSFEGGVYVDPAGLLKKL